jgi:nucleolar protein 9
MPHESQLAGSFYGKFFARNLNLYMLKRRPDEWRSMQSQKKQNAQVQGQATQSSTQQQPQKSTAPPVGPVSPTAHLSSKEERKRSKKRSKPADEIDDLFDQALGKKVKKAALEGVDDRPKQSAGKVEEEAKEKKGKKVGKDASGLDAVLGALKAAPKHEDGRPKKKHKPS